MSKLLHFITSFASSAELRVLSQEELRVKMELDGLSDAEISAILSGDKARIAQLVKSAGDIVCCIIAPDQPEEEPLEEDVPAPERESA
ncbi:MULTISPECIES: hypothetical protein [Rheinheimera]|uniref:Uncharacterized protein n=1 Tax=Rheinheimera marina TaxID=1774958 RepID=A0ABV9JLD7_9GAMM